jgi:anti-sigma28 factor (negative regulator of flagellin synthesis)
MKTSVSEHAQLSILSAYLDSALAGSPANVAKVRELSATVSSGQYHVDAYAVSGSLIQHGIEFGDAVCLALNA